MKTLTTIRESKGYSRYKLSLMSGMSVSTLIRMEDKARGMNFGALCHLRRVLGVGWQALGKMLDDEFLDAPQRKKGEG